MDDKRASAYALRRAPKRRVPYTPTKRSPLQKQMSKGKHLQSPRRRAKSLKKLAFTQSKSNSTEELAKALSDDGDDGGPHEALPPLKIVRRKKLAPKVSSSQSSHDYWVEHPEQLQTNTIIQHVEQEPGDAEALDIFAESQALPVAQLPEDAEADGLDIFAESQALPVAQLPEQAEADALDVFAESQALPVAQLPEDAEADGLDIFAERQALPVAQLPEDAEADALDIFAERQALPVAQLPEDAEADALDIFAESQALPVAQLPEQAEADALDIFAESQALPVAQLPEDAEADALDIFAQSQALPVAQLPEQAEADALNLENTDLLGNCAPIVLSENDVPGAVLPKERIEDNVVKDLKRWLQCRAIPVAKRNKAALVELVNSCKDMGRDKLLYSGIDNNIHYEAKRNNMLLTQGFNSDHPPPIPKSGWDTFPSCGLSRNFNFGSVYHYLVESMPSYEGEDGHLDTSDESQDEEEIDENIVVLKDPFDDAENDEMLRSKKLRRGLQYYKSNYIRACKDVVEGNIHFIKAQVRASMNKVAYWVTVAMSKVSGRVIHCACDTKCVQRALGRCSHVSAVLLSILGHIRLNGYQAQVLIISFQEVLRDAITCTSRPCEWNKGSLERDPQIANNRQYESFKIDVKRRATFDVRPTAFQYGFPSQKEINNLLSALSYKDSHWQLLLKMKYPDGDYEEADLLGYFPEHRDQLYSNLKGIIKDLKPYPTYEGPLEVKSTRGQSSNSQWSHMRSLHATASNARRIAHFTTDDAKKNFLKEHMWNLNKCYTRAMAYGVKNKAAARKAYFTQKLEEDPTVQVTETGMFLHTKYIGLSCSPDGFMSSEDDPPKLLEIKCPYRLRNVHPNTFDEHLPHKTLSSYYLKRCSNGEITLNKQHAYYDQVQMCLGLTGLEECDFVVWSKEGMVILPVSFDESRWTLIREKLLLFHWRYQAPEYFLMRTVRDLCPLEIFG